MVRDSRNDISAFSHSHAKCVVVVAFSDLRLRYTHLHRQLGGPLAGDWVRQNDDFGLPAAHAHSITIVRQCSKTRGFCR